MIKKISSLIFFAFFISCFLNGQTRKESSYYNCKNQLSDMLSGKQNKNFKAAVFAIENIYYDNNLDSLLFENSISDLVLICKSVNLYKSIKYEKKDSITVRKWASIFKVITDTTLVVVLGDTLIIPPYTYNFEDVFGNRDWPKMFVSTLLREGNGNCHSLPYLYKILCNELKVPCHLALAPNHLYIKHRAEKDGWYNTELTSATFPIDAWLMASGYISLESVQKGVYMDTLSEKESISLCVLDLAQGYNHKYLDNDGKFIIECCDLALKYFPDYVNAILLKAETRLKQLQNLQKKYGYTFLKEVTVYPESKVLWDEMNSLYMQLYNLGYRQMPEQMYVEWLTSLKIEKEKYTNKQAPEIIRD
jgi:hypothetical protein